VPLSCNLGTLTYWNPLGHSRPVTGLLYFLPFYIYVNIAGVQPESFRFEVGVVHYRTEGVYHENFLSVCTYVRAHAVMQLQRNNLGAFLRNSVA
jgi:hypothetical protein